jgi:hypothetical protein
MIKVSTCGLTDFSVAEVSDRLGRPLMDAGVYRYVYESGAVVDLQYLGEIEFIELPVTDLVMFFDQGVLLVNDGADCDECAPAIYIMVGNY